MKDYPTISRIVRYGVPVYVFDKLDGSLIRVEWSRKRGFYKFGKRHGLLDDSNPILRRAEQLFTKKYNAILSAAFKRERWQKAVAYLEFHGPNSFAGNHDESEQQTVTMFDIAHDNKGFLDPKTFLKFCGDEIEHAKLLYVGNFTHPLEEQIRNGTLEGMTFEGVVAKGSYESPGMPMMFKCKSKSWLDKLHAKCETEEEFERLR